MELVADMAASSVCILKLTHWKYNLDSSKARSAWYVRSTQKETGNVNTQRKSENPSRGGPDIKLPR